MIFINENTNEYPRHIGDVQINPGERWKQVVAVPMPPLGLNQVAVENTPQKIDGIWYQQWTVVDLSEDQIKEIQEQSLKNRPKNEDFN